MEEKLLRYRRERAKEKLKEDLKNKVICTGSRLKSYIDTFLNFISRAVMSDDEHVVEIEDSSSEEDNTTPEELPFNYHLYLTIFIVWSTVYAFFIYIEFGAVYFCVTGILFIYLNTRTGRRLRNEVSAYSVFNRNCEQIDGTFTAEQFDKQIRSGMII